VVVLGYFVVNLGWLEGGDWAVVLGYCVKTCGRLVLCFVVVVLVFCLCLACTIGMARCFFFSWGCRWLVFNRVLFQDVVGVLY